MVVCSGDVISIQSNRPTTAEVTLSWSQSWRNRNQKYYVTKYTNISRANDAEHEGGIFIQADMWDHLKGRANVKGDNMEFTVNNDFQYGQRKDGSHRFLVFHNKDQKPYQHRFVETAAGNQMLIATTNLANDLGIEKFVKTGSVGEVAKNFVGDYLHNI